jgi:branched-chain amino acid transport system permease protein
MILQVIAYGIVIGALYGLVAIGLALIFGVAKYLNIAHGSFIMIGGYVSFWLFTLWHLDPFASIPLVIIIMFLIGLILYKALFAPLSKLPEGQKINNSMLVTFGLLWVLDNAGILAWTSDTRRITPAYFGEMLEFFGIRLPVISLGVVALALVVVFALDLILSKTYFGKSIRATTQDWEAAKLMGINVDLTYLVTCGIGVALAGIAGTSIAVMYSITPGGGLEWLLIAMVVLVLAGLGNIRGIFIAGVILGFIEAFSVYIVGAQYRAAIGLIIIVLVLLFRPQGLFSKRTRGIQDD